MYKTLMIKKPRVLIIEDDIDLQELLEAFFRQKDIDVDKLSNGDNLRGADAPRLLQADVLLVDYDLPGLNGLNVIDIAREKNVAAPIIMLTASDDVNLAVDAVDHGAFDFLVKPVSFPQLYMSVQRALRYRDVQKENFVLRDSLTDDQQTLVPGIVGRSPALKSAIDLALRVAKAPASVLLLGESGSGKEVFARLIHQKSGRPAEKFVPINCSAIPEQLLESELFGHAKGSFTGAVHEKRGLFEVADQGTLFLDEIGDLPMALQAKLLRTIQERTIRRVGDNKTIHVDVRLIAATHKDLQAEVRAGHFREDLYFRLNVIPLRVPPLRERTEDILPLALYFMKRFAVAGQKHIDGFSKEAAQFLTSNTWPGNVRELQNMIERAVTLATSKRIELVDFLITPDAQTRVGAGAEIGTPEEYAETMREWPELLGDVEKLHIANVLKKYGGAKTPTAKALGIDRKTLYRKIKEHSLDN